MIRSRINKAVSLSLPLLFLYGFIFVAEAQITKIETVFSEMFETPLGIEYSHEGSRLMYIVRRDGNVDVKDLDNPDAPSSNFMDISHKVTASGELGLLGMAFSPDYPDDDRFYLYYAYEEGGEYYSTLARYSVSDDGVGDPNSEERLFELYQPQNNHNGGQIVFGPNGYLYIALGDGGRYSRELAQNTQVLNGSILRIDVSPETGYDIPLDNPFVGDSTGLDEIYAWGLRNPWRISFDPVTGNLWAADVGQKDRESIYIIEKGKNYGWPIIEGTICYPIGSDCDKKGLELPVFEYQYGSSMGRSITGGYVYRGEQHPSLVGKYIYGDFISKKIFALEIDHKTREVLSNTEIGASSQNLPTFGVDSAGEIYIGGWADGVNSGIFRLVPELTLTTAVLKSIDGSGGIQLSWDVNKESGIDSFALYKGTSVDSMQIYDTVAGDVRDFIDASPFEGASFYAVQAIETDGNEGKISNPVSYYKKSETVSDSWQMISLPYDTTGVTISGTIVYSFNGSYSVAEQLQPVLGYWIRSTADGGSDYVAEGPGVQSSTMQLNPGWNLVGGLVGELPNEFLVDDAGILNSTPLYGFDGSVYQVSNSFVPGQGYWLYAENAGEITLDLDSLMVSSPLKNVVSKQSSALKSTGSFDKIEFVSGGETANLLVAENRVSTEILNRYRIPPIAPNAVLDVRTKEGFRLAEGNRIEPDVTIINHPLLVRFASTGDGTSEQMTGSLREEAEVVYKLTIYKNGESESTELREGESYLIAEEYDRMEFQRMESDSEIVQQTELLPSYPNPFNPVATIAYRLSEQQQVTLTVFDVAGRRIATLVDSEQDAGQYMLPFDASGLASGIYFVRFSAGDMLSTQKLTLIK